jgi:hypothetical protein
MFKSCVLTESVIKVGHNVNGWVLEILTGVKLRDHFFLSGHVMT